jgi:hypothetical protein
MQGTTSTYFPPPTMCVAKCLGRKEYLPDDDRLQCREILSNARQTSVLFVGVRVQHRAQPICRADQAREQPEAPPVRSSKRETALSLWQSFLTLIRNPAASQKVEKEWAIARRNRRRFAKRLSKAFWYARCTTSQRIIGTLPLYAFPASRLHVGPELT